MIILDKPPARLIYYPAFLERSYYDQLRKELPWQQRHIIMFGKKIAEPRFTAWFGQAYSYSGLDLQPAPMPGLITEIMDSIESHCHFGFNSVLANNYRSGLDYMGWHSDNEKQLDSALIASASFGASRFFRVKHRLTGEVIELKLEDRSLLLMYDLQKEWKHSLPKTMKIQEGRINLTFRKIV